MLQVLTKNTSNINSYLLRRQSKPSPGAGQSTPQVDILDEKSLKRALHCVVCDHVISFQEAQCERVGSHEHIQVNPQGVTFAFGCFAVAPGVAVVSPPTGEYSWFPGYEWQVTVCANCQEHMGWLFSQSQDYFYGLLFEKIFSD